MEKYINDQGRVGVIVSGGFGAGWSTWAPDDDNDFYAMCKELVRMKLTNENPEHVAAYCEKIKGERPYMGGWEGARIEWLNKGTNFTIEEYGGSESIRPISDLSMTA